MEFNAKLQMEGEYYFTATSETTGKTRSFGPCKNIITNLGLNRIGTAGAATHIYIGTGSGTPAVTDTGMFTFLAASSTNQGSGNITPGGSPDYWSGYQFTRRFAAGTATGNLTEVGVGWAADPAGAIFSHALIVDGSGNPVTLTILADETLDVTYVFRLYPMITDVTGSVSIASVSYAYILRSATLPATGGAGNLLNNGISGTYAIDSYSGTIGTITGSPSGTSASAGSGVLAAYANNSYERSATWTAGLTSGNVGGTRSVTADYSGGQLAPFQCQFTPAIPKDATKVLTLTFKITWARRTP